MRQPRGPLSFPQPLETVYAGYRFRSRLEARWAVFFEALNLQYTYEPEGFALSNGMSYLPDFWLPNLHVFFEVKPTSPDKEAIAKCRYLAKDMNGRVLLTVGMPTPDLPHLTLYEPEASPLQGAFAWCRRGEHLCFASHTEWIDPATQEPMLGRLWECFGHETPGCADRWPVSSVQLDNAFSACRRERFGIFDTPQQQKD